MDDEELLAVFPFPGKSMTGSIAAALEKAWKVGETALNKKYKHRDTAHLMMVSPSLNVLISMASAILNFSNCCRSLSRLTLSRNLVLFCMLR